MKKSKRPIALQMGMMIRLVQNATVLHNSWRAKVYTCRLFRSWLADDAVQRVPGPFRRLRTEALAGWKLASRRGTAGPNPTRTAS